MTSTTPGYSNGRFADPTYEQVYTDTTGFAETVRVTYNPATVSLDLLCRLFFMIIDPLSLNKQGEDCGTRYRTGVYYSAEDDLPVLQAAFAAEASRLGADPVTELLPLQCFYGAEEYHQDYLDKNPGGYCHLSLKTFSYLKVFEKVRLYLAEETDPIARMAETAAIIHEGMHFFWTGFYRVYNDQLVLGPFQGPPACLRIAFGRGVCGTAWKEGRTIVVPDVEQFPGHIACSSASRSEIVVPVFAKDSDSGPGNGSAPTRRITAVLDIDSDRLDAFDTEDARWLELILDL